MKAVLSNWQRLGVIAVVLLGAADLLAATKASTTSSGAATPKALTDSLEFKNGDRLRGTFAGYDAGGARWKHQAIEQVLTVKPSEISIIRIERPRSSQETAYNCVAVLGGGDELAGSLLGLDNQKLRLETWYGGTLEIARTGVRSLWLGFRKDEIVYQGPTSLQGWKVGRGIGGFIGRINVVAGGVDAAEEVIAEAGDAKETPSWEYKDGAFIANGRGTLGRDVKLPDDALVEFDLECQNYPQLGIYLYTDSVERTSGITGFYLNLAARRAYLNRMTGTTSRSVGSTEVPMLDGTQNKLRVGIRTSLEQKALVLYLNDILAHKWSNIGDLPKAGSALLFYYMGSTQVKISNLRVSKAMGPIEDLAGSAPTVTGKDDLVILNNRDKISGQLQAIKDGQVDFLLQSNPIKIPVERVRWLHLAGADNADSKPSAKSVRLNFALRGAVAIEMEKWEGDQVTGRSPHLGDVKFATAAFKSIQFDLNPPRPAATPVSSSTTTLPMLQPGVIRRW